MKYSDGLRVYREAKNSKNQLTTLQQKTSALEQQLELRLRAEEDKRKIVDSLSEELEEIRSHNTTTQTYVLELEKKYQLLIASKEKATQRAEFLKCRLKELKSSCMELNKRVIDNCDTLPEAIANLKEQLQAIEADIHKCYENVTNIQYRTSIFERYESLLDSQLKNSIDEIGKYMEKLVTSQKMEKNLQKQLDKLTVAMEQAQLEAKELVDQQTDCRNQIMRKKLLLHNKKKAGEADRNKQAKKLQSLRSEIETYKTRVNQQRQHRLAIEDQINLERETRKNLSKDQLHVDSIIQLLTQLTHEWEATI